MSSERGVRYWLMKSEPDAFSIADLRKKKRSHWDGVRSFMARNQMQAMRVGDLALFYHSSTEPPGVVGLSRVVREAYPDHTQFDRKSKYYDARATKDKPRWFMVDVEFVERFPNMVTLADLKADPALNDMLVVRRGMRLSVQPVEPEHMQRVLAKAGAQTKLA
ncbi:MAG TPA: EVE domain-containing protein [Polyangiales bacterium]|nr:EVE domain-containing protein [Polyangiales bacterium]